MKPFHTICLFVLASSSLLAQKDSAMAELTKMRETLSHYQPAAGAENSNVILKKSTYDSLLALLSKQQQQLSQSKTEVEGIRKKLQAMNSALPELTSKDQVLVYFETGSKNLSKAFELKIRELVSANGSDKNYIANGFADAEGTKEINEELSRSRALEVKKYMVETLKLKPEQVITNGFGSEHRLCESIDEACNRQNRRVEIKTR